MRESSDHLEYKCRFADTRISTDKDHGAWYEAPAQGAVKLDDARFKTPLKRGEATSWGEVDGYISKKLDQLSSDNKKVVLLPIYGVEEDDIAISIYEQAMPDYEIRGILSDYIIELCGAVHCTTITRPLI